MICKCSVMLMFKKAAAFARGGMPARCIAAMRWPWIRLPGKRNPHFHSTSSPRTKVTQACCCAVSQPLSNGCYRPLWWTQVWDHVQLSQSLRFYKGNAGLFDNNSGDPLLVIFTTDWREAKISSSHLYKDLFIFESALICWKTHKPCRAYVTKSISFLFFFLCACRTFSHDLLSWMEQWLTTTDVLDCSVLRIKWMGLRGAR